MKKEKIEEILSKFPGEGKEALREALENKKPDENCNHIWKQVGFWDGCDKDRNPTGGPTAKCVKCEGRKYFTWSDWNRLSKRRKV